LKLPCALVDRRPLLRLLAVVVASVVTATPAFAQGPASAGAAHASRPPGAVAPSADWKALSSAQRSALAPLQREWPSLDDDRKQQWLDVAAHFPHMSAAERQRVQARMSDWARMSPKERGQARLNYQELRQLSPEERQARWMQYQALSPEQRRKLAAHAQPASGPAHVLHPAPPLAPKSNLVMPVPPRAGAPRAIGPDEIQAKPGATTTLISRRPSPPPHQQPGMPKVAATPGFVDRHTLLPERGAQGAGVRRPKHARPASAAASHP
jgi:hypothetical protein